ncbi:hypothetical protein HAZT_HAZT002315 [Hyalella azteca]|uniref:C2H2-type domain-containing protein n=1 Tax=Hyalella azteca TaxID=294128 RepID=A0A6A0HBV0_HYAAZ|nr:hypothetical protein HAZT_HAZT002315 [Hyalella azteca]
MQMTMDASDSLATSEVLLTNLSSEDNSSSTNVASSTASPASQTHISSPNSITSTRRRSRCRRSTTSSIASTFVASSSASPSSSESDSLFSIDSPVDLRYVQNNGLQEDKIQPNGDTINNVNVNTQPNNNTLKDIQNNTQSNSDTINNNRESGYACSSWQDTFSTPARRRRHDPSKQHKITQDNIHPTHHSNTQATHHSSTKTPEARAPMSPAKRNLLMEDFDLRLPELSSPESSLLSPASLPGLLSPTPRSSFLSSTTQPSVLSPTPRPSLLSTTSRPSLLSHTTRYEQPSLLSPTSRPSLLSPTPRSSLLSPTSRHSLLPSSRSSFFHSPASPTNYSSREVESNEVAAAGAVLLNLDSCTVMPHSHNLVPWLPCSPQQHQQHHHFQHPGVVIQSSTTNSGESNSSMCFSTSDILRNISSYLSPKRVGADTPGFDEGSAGLGCLETSLNLASYDNEMAVLSPAKSPSKMAGFKAAHRILTSPQPSTSGLGKRGLGALVQDQDYEFDYDSDGYADSDSELAALTRSSLPLEQWKCHECNKTFKSLKEKLLHAGKHSPSCGGPDAAGMPPFVENPPDAANFTDDCQDTSAKCLQVGHEDVKPLVKMELPLYGSSDAQSAVFEQQLLMQQKLSLQMLEACRTESRDFKCPECFLLFSSADELLNHRKKVLGSKNFCPLCHEEFSSWWQKSNHIKTSHISQHFTCSFCYVTYKSLSNWRRHQLVHLGLVPFECKRCGKRFTRRYELLQHERVHTGEKPYTCPQCAKTFANESNLRRHLFTHSQDQQTSCKVCNKSYKNARSLMKHKLVVHSVAGKPAKIQRDFICSYENCGMIFPSVKKLSWHQETHQRWPKRCDFCQERFVHQSNLVKHIRQKHDPQYMQDKEGNKTCPVCFKVFLKTSLPLHMRIHSGVKPYKCYMCNKKFRVKCNLDTHMFIHSGKRDRPFKCNLCVRSFCRDKDLDAHVRSHKNIRPFICNECGKSFIHKNNLTAHMAQHSGQKEHKCAYCGKTFFRKYNLINHERVHTGETPYSCPICGKTFTQKSNYNVHRKSFHVDRHAVHEEI